MLFSVYVFYAQLVSCLCRKFLLIVMGILDPTAPGCARSNFSVTKLVTKQLRYLKKCVAKIQKCAFLICSMFHLWTFKFDMCVCVLLYVSL